MAPNVARGSTRLILIGAPVLLSIGMGLRQSIGLFLTPVTRDLALTAADFTLTIAIQNIVWGLAQAPAGAIADRFGLRLTLVAGTMTLRVRELNDHERVDVQRIARSHTLGAALVRRAQIVVHAMDGLKAEEIATRMDLCGNTVRHWLNRFNARGLDGLKEDVRTGRPPTYSAEQRSTVITAALTRPSELGLPFASWTLDRLVSYLSEQGIAMRRSRISEIFIREGLRWRQDETWFGARVDPDFAKKRGRSNSSTRRRQQAA